MVITNKCDFCTVSTTFLLYAVVVSNNITSKVLGMCRFLYFVCFYSCVSALTFW